MPYLATIHNFVMYQMDVNTAFLNDGLQYMSQSSRFGSLPREIKIKTAKCGLPYVHERNNMKKKGNFKNKHKWYWKHLSYMCKSKSRKSLLGVSHLAHKDATLLISFFKDQLIK